MKMYSKSDLTLVDGLLVANDGTIVMPDMRIVVQANKLEDMVQERDYLLSQPEHVPAPTMEGFERVSINDKYLGEFRAETPTIDSKIDEAMTIMDEIDKTEAANKANELQEAVKEFMAFVSNDYVIDCGGNPVMPFDTPMIGNVLKVDHDEVVTIIGYLAGATNTNIHHHAYDEEDAAIDDSDLTQLLKEIDDFCNSVDELDEEEKSEEE